MLSVYSGVSVAYFYHLSPNSFCLLEHKASYEVLLEFSASVAQKVRGTQHKHS